MMNPNTEKIEAAELRSASRADPEVNLNSPPKSKLLEFANNMWIVDGPNVRYMGVIFTTRMTIVRLADGSLWVDSPVSVTFDKLKRITALGHIRYLVAAAPGHVWRLEMWHTLFPDAQLWPSRPTLFTLKKGQLPYAGILSDTPYQGWADDFDQLAFRGNPLIEEVLFFHKETHTIILDDLIQIHPMAKGKTTHNALIKLEGVAFPQGGVGLDLRLSFTNHKLTRESLEKLLSWDFDKLIIAHGNCIEKDAKPFVEQAFRWLAR